jgi:hypothetical protein
MTDYMQIPIPDKPQDEYTYNERRAEILQMIEKKGHPWGFNYSQLGRDYGVTHETIRHDFSRLREYYTNQIGDDAKAATEIAYKKILREQMDESEYEAARRTLDSWSSWLQDTGHQDKEPDQHEVEGDGIVINYGDE